MSIVHGNSVQFVVITLCYCKQDIIIIQPYRPQNLNNSMTVFGHVWTLEWKPLSSLRSGDWQAAVLRVAPL